jgi:vitamin B12 transporter
MMVRRKLLLGCAVSAPACLIGLSAHGQTVDIGEVVITANRTPTDKSKVGSTVEVVGKKKIEQQSKPLITDYLTLVPGVNVASPGGMGQETSLSVRGADKKYVKTLFDGIDISDPTSTQVQTPYQNLLAGGITNMELLKGSQSTLYGADAIAGVLSISTLDDIAPGIHNTVLAEGGSFGTWRGGYSLTGASDTGKMALGLYGLTTDGISAALVNGSPTVDSNPNKLENDPYRNVTATFAGQQQLSDNFSVFGSGLYIKASGGFDDSGYPPTDNTYNKFRTAQIAGRAGFNLDFLDGRVKNKVSFQAFDIDRDLHLVSGFGPYDVSYKGVRTKVDYQGSYAATDRVTLQYGADYERQSAHSTDNYGADNKNSVSISGIWGQADFEPIDNLALTAGLRHDDHSVFGGYTTYRLTGSYRLPRRSEPAIARRASSSSSIPIRAIRHSGPSRA